MTIEIISALLLNEGGCFSFLCNITVYTSTISMSSMDFPADFRAALDAGAGPMPIIFGSQPVKL